MKEITKNTTTVKLQLFRNPIFVSTQFYAGKSKTVCVRFSIGAIVHE